MLQLICRTPLQIPEWAKTLLLVVAGFIVLVFLAVVIFVFAVWLRRHLLAKKLNAPSSSLYEIVTEDRPLILPKEEELEAAEKRKKNQEALQWYADKEKADLNSGLKAIERIKQIKSEMGQMEDDE